MQINSTQIGEVHSSPNVLHMKIIHLPGTHTSLIDKIDMTLGQGQWPRVTGRTGQIQCALLLEKSVVYYLTLQ